MLTFTLTDRNGILIFTYFGCVAINFSVKSLPLPLFIHTCLCTCWCLSSLFSVYEWDAVWSSVVKFRNKHSHQ